VPRPPSPPRRHRFVDSRPPPPSSSGEPDYTYVTAAISRHGAGASPTFVSAADFALKPTFLQTYNVSTASGGFIWEFSDDVNGGGLMVATARHTEAQGVGGVDIAAALLPPQSAPIACTVLGFSSLSPSGATPAWAWNKTACAVFSVSFSDDGSTVVVTGGLDISQPKLAPFITALDGQSGAVKWLSGGDDASQFGGSAMVTEKGAFVAYSRADDTVLVLDGATGAPRGLALSMGWNNPAQLSDSGDYLAWAGEDNANIYQWDAAAQKYTEVTSFDPPGPSHAWYATGSSLSSDGSGAEGGELACFAYFCGAGANSNCSGTALQARVIIASLVTGNILTDYFTPVNDQLQTNANVKMDGDVCGVALWGDRDDVPTAVALRAGSSKPLLEYVTPGSMNAVDVVVDADGVYMTVAGRHVPANVMGMGGCVTVAPHNPCGPFFSNLPPPHAPSPRVSAVTRTRSNFRLLKQRQRICFSPDPHHLRTSALLSRRATGTTHPRVGEAR